MRKLFVSAFALLSVSGISTVHSETEVVNDPIVEAQAPAAIKDSKTNEIPGKASAELDKDKSADIPGEQPKAEPQVPNPDMNPVASEDKGVSALPNDLEPSSPTPNPNVSEDSGVSAIPDDLDNAAPVESGAPKAETQSSKDSKVLELKKVESKELFNNPNAFVSVLKPGYWHEVPHKVGDGWEGSILITADTLSHIMNKDGSKLADTLVREDALPAFRSGASQAIESAMGSVSRDDVEEVLHYLNISEIMTYEDILRNNGLFEKYQSTVEDFGKRPHIGINVKYSNGLSFDIAKVKELYRIDMAKEIEKHISSLKEKLEERNKFISSSEQVKLSAIQKLENEKAAAQKIVDGNKDVAAELEAKEKALNDAKAELKKAEAMPTRTSRNKNDRTKAINAANAKIASAQKAYDELLANLPAEYEAAKQKVAEADAQIAKLSADPDLAAAKIMDKKYDKDIKAILDKIIECYMRLAYLDPSKISAVALKAMKLSKDLKDKVAEWTSLKQRNDEIQKLIDANKDSATELEARKKTLDEANSELKKAEAMPTRTTRNKNDRTKAIKAAQAKVAPAQAAYEEQLKKLPPEYEPAKKEFDDNSEKIRELATSDVMEAKKILDAFESEKNATPVA